MPKEMERRNIICACGCGKEFIEMDSKYRKRKFINGHNTALRKNPDLMENVQCSWCNNTFKTRKIFHRRFCSRTCRAKHNGKKLKNDLNYKEKMRRITLKNGNRPPLHKGKDCWNWKGGISKTGRERDFKYTQWRRQVLIKDHFTCGICKTKSGGKLSAHHIKSWAKFPGLRYDVSNGQCLHYLCHMKLHGLNKKDRTAQEVSNA